MEMSRKSQKGVRRRVKAMFKKRHGFFQSVTKKNQMKQFWKLEAFHQLLLCLNKIMKHKRKKKKQENKNKPKTQKKSNRKRTTAAILQQAWI